MIRGCRFARLADAGKDELPLLLVEVVTAEVSRGCVLTVSKLQSDSESEPETDAGETWMDR